MNAHADEGYWSFLDGLQHNAFTALFGLVYGTLLEREVGLHKILLDQSNAVGTCVKWAASVGKLPGLDLLALPGGIFGSVLSVILKGYNYMFFPALVGLTNVVSLGLGFLCVTRIPMLFMKLYDQAVKALKRGIRAQAIKRYSRPLRLTHALFFSNASLSLPVGDFFSIHGFSPRPPRPHLYPATDTCSRGSLHMSMRASTG